MENQYTRITVDDLPASIEPFMGHMIAFITEPRSYYFSESCDETYKLETVEQNVVYAYIENCHSRWEGGDKGPSAYLLLNKDSIASDHAITKNTMKDYKTTMYIRKITQQERNAIKMAIKNNQAKLEYTRRQEDINKKLNS